VRPEERLSLYYLHIILVLGVFRDLLSVWIISGSVKDSGDGGDNIDGLSERTLVHS
jgi:hypothetical protein